MSAELDQGPALHVSGRPFARLMADGALVDLDMPDPRAVSLDAVASQLAQINRWGGALERPVSVAEHAILVWRIAPRPLKLAALLHDAHEALIGDISRPLKRLIEARAPGAAAWLARVQWRIDVAMARATLDAAGWAGREGADHAAEALANEMYAPALQAADEEAARAELAALGPPSERARLGEQGGASLLGQSIFLAWGRSLAGETAERWLDLVKLEARAWGGAP